MEYVNVGVVLVGFDAETGQDTQTPFRFKTHFAAALKERPEELLFTSTSHGVGPGKAQYRGNELDSQYTYQVAGPDPYTARRWFASVQVKDGKAVVTA